MRCNRWSPNIESSIPATHSRHYLGKGAIVGVVIGIVASLALAAFFLSWYFRRGYRGKKEPQSSNHDSSEESPDEGRHEMDGPALYEADGIHYYELYYEGLQVVVNADPRFELSGSVASYELADNRTVRNKDWELGSPETRQGSVRNTTRDDGPYVL